MARKPAGPALTAAPSVLARALAAKEMKQSDFAMRMGCSTKHVSEVINGLVSISAEFAVKCELVLGLRADELTTPQMHELLANARDARRARLDVKDVKDVTVTLMIRGAITVGFEARTAAKRMECVHRAKAMAWDRLSIQGGNQATLEYDDAAGHDVYFNDEEIKPECDGVHNGCEFRDGVCQFCGQPAERAEDAGS